MAVSNILKKASKNWDGGYVMCGFIGHGDAFALRDPNGIRPAYYYKDDEIVVVTSERPVIQTSFNVPNSQIKEIKRGHALIIKKNGKVIEKQGRKPLSKTSCSFINFFSPYFAAFNIYIIFFEVVFSQKPIRP